MSERFDARRIGYALAAPAVAAVVSLTVTSLALLAAGDNPLDAYRAMWSYIDSLDSLVAILNRATPYTIAGIAVAIGFKMNLFNIGVDGQYRLAALLAASYGAAVDLPAPLHVLSICVVAMFVGAGWALIPALLKVRRGVNEVIATIMLNSIATGLISYLLRTYLRDDSSAGLVARTPKIPPSGQVPSLNHALSLIGIDLPDNAQLYGFVLVAIGLAIGYHLLVWRTRFGYELRASGSNPSAARAAGVDPKRMIVTTMLISGAVAGLIGMGPLLGDPQYFSYGDQFPTAFGFTGISVALVGRNQPLGIVIAALLFATIERSTQALAALDIPVETSLILQGSIILSAVIAYEVVRRLSLAAAVRAAAARTDPGRPAPVAVPA